MNQVPTPMIGTLMRGVEQLLDAQRQKHRSTLVATLSEILSWFTWGRLIHPKSSTFENLTASWTMDTTIDYWPSSLDILSPTKEHHKTSWKSWVSMWLQNIHPATNHIQYTFIMNHIPGTVLPRVVIRFYVKTLCWQVLDAVWMISRRRGMPNVTLAPEIPEKISTYLEHLTMWSGNPRKGRSSTQNKNEHPIRVMSKSYRFI